MTHEWLIFSLILLGIWFVIYIAKPLLRKEMLWVSVITMFFGLTEPLFVPAYWHPPSLFNLAATTGFDIESFIFCFAVGGIAAVLYETIFKAKHKKLTKKKKECHKLHKLAVISPIIVFIALHFLTEINPIYSASIALFVGAIATIICRLDLIKQIITGGILFLVLYFVFFLLINLVFPGFVDKAWTLEAISGIILLGVPLEELMFAFTFGMMWSSVFEHILGYGLTKK
jgi:hypothetical protein